MVVTSSQDALGAWSCSMDRELDTGLTTMVATQGTAGKKKSQAPKKHFSPLSTKQKHPLNG